MINEFNIQRLDEIIGDYDSPFFNYLLYSYDLSLNDCEVIIEDLKRDIEDNKIMPVNIVSTLEDYFKRSVTNRQKESKITYLSNLIRRDNDFYIKFLARYDILDEDIDLIYEKVRAKIISDNIPDFEIKRLLIYYFNNSVKQITYLKDLNIIRGRAYDTLIIKKAYRNHPNLIEQDIVEIVLDIQSEILDAKEFRNGIKRTFLNRCMQRSEKKKAQALSNLEYLVEGSGDSFSKLVSFKGLSKSEGNTIVSEIRDDIENGSIQPEDVDNIFLTKRFNEYNERE